MAGWFLKVMKIYNGIINNIIVPAEQDFSGWMNFEKCLKSFFIRTGGNSRVTSNRSTKTQKIYPGKQEGTEKNKDEELNRNDQGPIFRKPSLALVIIKHSSQTSWGLVKDQMHKKLGKATEVVPFADDRAVVWCDSEEELKLVLEKGDLYRGRLFIGKIKKWNMHMH